MHPHSLRRLPVAVLVVLLPVVCGAGVTPQSAVEELLAADRAFSAASATSDLVTGLSAMFAEEIVMPTPAGVFAEGQSAAGAALRAHPQNLTPHPQGTPGRARNSAHRPARVTARVIT